ncbi:NAD(P)-dependent dehydrogenase (short-subunit alcohol dehydrogenase family) [Novosphingobium chloroacetimidivorans]|uniref:NAD(P)-dependent dehydrogenase (Short-subunit alcohol dehydrogenase family) n=1 Tax=Novosphingobium chloroacetimidivorans TaxID=1428314 RepID=A0A7W7KD34_9SPHN|nr:SDR family oxidoreductase [Novosphingobium chloroacetimidivorans]MBB4860295.1 NAD(P)-dependent dehydrogenase (short-subunit alcohol dehydrogenase family) [Novosphingobium chloroacetimidivorans]
MEDVLKIDKLFSVEGKVAAITGGASGIGLIIAKALVANGARVRLIDLNPSAIDAAVAQLGTQASGVVANVVDRASLDEAFAAIDEECGGIDIVFANAGVGGNPGFGAAPEGQNAAGTIDGGSDAEWKQVLDVNVMGVRNTLASAARAMKRHGRGGKIVITSSCAALMNVPFVSTVYHASKAAVSHMGRQVAIELAPFGIHVNMISPANFVTGIGDGSMQDGNVQNIFARTSLLGRMARLDEVVGVALLFASDASSYLTGLEIPVDGGSLIAGRQG